MALRYGADVTAKPATIVLRLKDTAKGGLGVPLPAGTTTLYTHRGGDRLLLGEGTVADTAVGETVRLVAGTSTQVLAEQVRVSDHVWRATLTNANRQPATVQVSLGETWTSDLRESSVPLPRIDGVQTWRVTVPGNGIAELRYGEQ